MRKRILIPTDFSKNAWTAIEYALELYKREDVVFYFLNAYEDSPEENAAELSQLGLEKILQQLSIKTSYPGHIYKTISQKQYPIDAIKKMVDVYDIDLIIMGTKGETDAGTILYGRYTIDAMEEVRSCPVMAIPKGFKYCDPKEIVFPTSFKTHYKSRELQHLFEISRITNAPIQIVHFQNMKLTEIQSQNKILLEEILTGTEFNFHWVENKKLHDGLLAFVDQRQSGMIAFINKKHNFFQHMFSDTLVKKLGVYSQVPVLALHDIRN